MVTQFRPPVAAYTIELPAGLIDAGETVEEAGVRELKEETGYLSEKCMGLGGILANFPEMTRDTMRFVVSRTKEWIECEGGITWMSTGLRGRSL